MSPAFHTTVFSKSKVMKKFLFAAALSFVFCASVYTQERPDLSQFTIVGVTNDTAFLSAGVVKKGTSLQFSLLMAQAVQDYEGLHLNPDEYALMLIKASCKDKSYEILSDRGMRSGQLYTGKKIKKQRPDPRSNIGKVISLLCGETPARPRMSGVEL